MVSCGGSACVGAFSLVAFSPPLLIWIVGEEKNWDLALLTCATAFLISGLAALGINAEKPIAGD